MTATPSRLDPSFRAGRKKRRLVRLMAAGASAAKAAAKLGITDQELDAFTADPDLPEMVEAYRDLYGRPREEIFSELQEIAVRVLVESVEEQDPKVCAWFFRELQRRRDPAVTLAQSVIRAQERAQREAEQAETPPPPKLKRVLWPPRAYDDLEALRQSVTVALRDRILVEAAHKSRDAAQAAPSEPPTPPPAPPEPPPALTRRPETQADRDMRRVMAKLMGKRLRVRDFDFDTS